MTSSFGWPREGSWLSVDSRCPLRYAHDRSGVDDLLGFHAGRCGSGTSQLCPLELARSMRVGVDGEQASGLECVVDEVIGRVLSLGA
jgi:hypothetical protein